MQLFPQTAGTWLAWEQPMIRFLCTWRGLRTAVIGVIAGIAIVTLVVLADRACEQRAVNARALEVIKKIFHLDEQLAAINKEAPDPDAIRPSPFVPELTREMQRCRRLEFQDEL